MTLTTCLGTTYKMIADKMHLTISAINVKAIADKKEKDFITDIHLHIYVSSKDSQEELEKTLDLQKKIAQWIISFIKHKSQWKLHYR